LIKFVMHLKFTDRAGDDRVRVFGQTEQRVQEAPGRADFLKIWSWKGG
jgi:hypothetical protein